MAVGLLLLALAGATLVVPPLLMTLARRWSVAGVVTWVLAGAALGVWTTRSVVLADASPGGVGPRLGDSAWFLTTVAALVLAVLTAGRRRL